MYRWLIVKNYLIRGSQNLGEYQRRGKLVKAEVWVLHAELLAE